MGATAFSNKIRAQDPLHTDLAVVRDDNAGTVTLVIQTGRNLATIKLDARGWRELSHGLGVPPASGFVPRVRTAPITA